MLTDSHCHLASHKFPAEEVPLLIARARAAGVTRLVSLVTGLDDLQANLDIAAAHPEVSVCIGIHPCEVHEAPDDAIDRLRPFVSDARVCGIGETGLDFFRTGDDGRAAQEESFRRHIDLAIRLGKTLQIHDRDAHDAVLDVLDQVGTPDRWVMHCFSGDADFAKRCLDRGAYLSFSGTVTFGNAGDIREALAIAPKDRILVETDAPFLTPTPHRGKTNSAYLIPVTMRAMASVRDADLEELCVQVNANTEAAYGGSW